MNDAAPVFVTFAFASATPRVSSSQRRQRRKDRNRAIYAPHACWTERNGQFGRGGDGGGGGGD